ncbi:MAG: 2-oxoacid:ferredoxin oxidoreductase subunit beta [Myxococcaceae bacterium]
MQTQTAAKLTKKDFQSDQEVRWCPGCGDYSIIAQVQKVLPELGIPRENVVFVSGIGCSSRFPYYMNTYGFHTIHGRAAAIANGVKLSRPELQVWVITGDGDGMAIGGNHFIHTMRRNSDLKVVLFNNRIYGLTKGQVSPTSEQGKITKTTPYGSIDRPFNPLQLALGAGATFVARSNDADPVHLAGILTRAAAHKGTAFIEVLQNCVVFNDGAFDAIIGKPVRDETTVKLEHGKPVIFGKAKDKGVKLNGYTPEVVKLGNGVTEKDLLVWDEKASAGLAFEIAALEAPLPMPMGVFRAISRPSHSELEYQMHADVTKAKGVGDLQKLLKSKDCWTVK